MLISIVILCVHGFSCCVVSLFCVVFIELCSCSTAGGIGTGKSIKKTYSNSMSSKKTHNTTAIIVEGRIVWIVLHYYGYNYHDADMMMMIVVMVMLMTLPMMMRMGLLVTMTIMMMAGMKMII